jgi:hypothetical protein
MSQDAPPRDEVASVARAPIRSAMLSTSRLLIVCPSPALSAEGKPESSWLGRRRARLRYLVRLWSVRAAYRHRGVLRVKAQLVQLRMLLRLALLRVRVRRRLKGS